MISGKRPKMLNDVLMVYGKETYTQRYTHGLDVVSVTTWDNQAESFSDIQQNNLGRLPSRANSLLSDWYL